MLRNEERVLKFKRLRIYCVRACLSKSVVVQVQALQFGAFFDLGRPFLQEIVAYVKRQELLQEAETNLPRRVDQETWDGGHGRTKGGETSTH